MQEHPTFHSYCFLGYFYRIAGDQRGALAAYRQASSFPATSFSGPGPFTNGFYYYDAARYCYSQDEIQLAIDFCDGWENFKDAEWVFAIRAASLLALGRAGEAREQIQLLNRDRLPMRGSGGDLDALRRALDSGNTSYRQQIRERAVSTWDVLSYDR